jgi:hypothetical protein
MAWLRQTLMLWEMNSALASLGIVYAVSQSHCFAARFRLSGAVAESWQEDELAAIYSELESRHGAFTYEAWLSLLVSLIARHLTRSERRC